MMKKLTVAIDGPASSGKSTIAKLIAKKHQLIYLDTGAMYRCVTLFCLNENIDCSNEALVSKASKEIDITFQNDGDTQRVFLNGNDVTKAIRDQNVTSHVSLVSSYEAVRKEMVSRQQNYIQDGGIIMDGRDIGTVVMPNATLKIFMIASARVRAQRRYDENIAKGIVTSSLDVLEQEIRERDLFDSTREVTPLKKAEDAIEIDTTSLTIDEVVCQISNMINAQKV
ncbi:(d)CMP kinase [Carnobacteriaceae bacterium zg-C25]|nr:(d)CMP kinase [Carnobacteriaceae bacterium zg-C25]